MSPPPRETPNGLRNCLSALIVSLLTVAAACESPTDSRAEPSVCPDSGYSPSFLPAGTPEEGSAYDGPARTPPLIPIFGCTSFVLQLEIPDFDAQGPATTILSVGPVVDGSYRGAFSRVVDGPAAFPFLLTWTVVPLTGEPMVGPDSLTVRTRAEQYAPPMFNSLVVARDSIDFRVSVIKAGEPLRPIPDTVTIILRRLPPD